MSRRSRGADDPNYWYLALGILLVASPAAMVAFDTGDASYRYERAEIVADEDGYLHVARGDSQAAIGELRAVGCFAEGSQSLTCQTAAELLTNASGEAVTLPVEWYVRDISQFVSTPYLQLVSNRWSDPDNATLQLYQVQMSTDLSVTSVTIAPTDPATALDEISTPYDEAPGTVRTAIDRNGFRSSDRIDDEWLGEVVEQDDRHYVVTEVRRERYGGWPDDKRAVGYGLPVLFGIVAIVAGARGGLYR